MRIGIFGGTFNPVHNGHKMLAVEIMKKARLDKIIVIPTYSPPHKEGNELASGEHRLKMCGMMFSEECFSVSDIEIKREGKSYTFDTLLSLKEIYPSDELFLIIGSDMLLSFHEWYRFREILSMVTLCVASREEAVSVKELFAYAQSTLQLKRNEIIIAKFEPYECSSTDVRQMIEFGLDASDLTMPEVFDYARVNLLYSSPYPQQKKLLREKLDDYRFLHSLNVAESAKMLAVEYGEDEDKAYLAGLLHDVMKNTSDDKQLQIMEKGGIILSPVEKNNKNLWHAISGEAYLRTQKLVTDSDILNAVRYHTTGRSGMSLLEKIIYVADYISAERNYPDVNVMRQLVLLGTLEQACLYSLQYTFKKLSQQKSVIHPDSVEFYNELVLNEQAKGADT